MTNMAYGFLRKVAQDDENVKTFIQEGQVFEAFIHLIRESDLSADKIWSEIEKEGYLKNSRLTEDEYESLAYEWEDYTRMGQWKEE